MVSYHPQVFASMEVNFFHVFHYMAVKKYKCDQAEELVSIAVEIRINLQSIKS